MIPEDAHWADPTSLEAGVRAALDRTVSCYCTHHESYFYRIQQAMKYKDWKPWRGWFNWS
jgi:hypothetical protein